jgi:hypothetical protein
MNGIILEYDEVEYLHKYWSNIKFIEKKYKCSFNKCPDCKGSGLANVIQTRNNDFMWDGTYCQTCKGTKFRNINLKRNDIFLCFKCKGFGCDLCDSTGFIDWITNITRDE